MDELALRLSLLFKQQIDAYLIDFFVDDYWSNVPPVWKRFMENARNEDWAKVLDPSASVGTLPLAVLCLRRLIFSFVDSRRGVRSPNELSSLLPIKVPGTCPSDDFLKITSRESLRVRIKEKKQHEIDRIVALLKILHQDGTGFDFAVDVGAGLGHLSRIMALEMPSVSVQTIEGNSKFVELSQEIDVRTRNRLRSDVAMPKRVECFLDPSSSASFDDGLGDRGVLLGLHPCGDLSATILRSFVAFEEIGALVLFGCCYHKLNGGTDKLFRQEWDLHKQTPQTLGFALSKRFANVELSYAGRELACHAVEQFAQQMGNESECGHSGHFYRALLELAIFRYTASEKSRHMPIKSVKNADSLTFTEYAEKALRGQDDLLRGVLHQIETNPEIRCILADSRLSSRRVFSFYCLRLLLAPVVEHILVSDRLSFLRENGFAASSFALFNPVNSPRNIVIVAQK